jgi:hypothetical protein
MERTEFFRKQADRLEKLSEDCIEPDIKAPLVQMANEYRAMLDGQGSDDFRTGMAFPKASEEDKPAT